MAVSASCAVAKVVAQFRMRDECAELTGVGRQGRIGTIQIIRREYSSDASATAFSEATILSQAVRIE